MTRASKPRSGFGKYPLAAYFWLLPPAAAAGGLALAPFQVVLGLLGTPLRSLKPGSAWLWAFLALLVGFVGYAVASSFWSLFPHSPQAWKLAGGVVCGLLFVAGAGGNDATRRLIRAAGAGGLAVLAMMLLLEAFADMPLNRMDQPLAETGALLRNPGRGATVLVCLLWPVIASLAGGPALARNAWKALAIAAAALALQFDMSSNALALGIGVVAFGFGYAAPRFTLILGSVGLALWMLAAPWVMLNVQPNAAILERLPDSWAVRVEMWRFVAERIAANPLLGLGLDASRTFDETSQVNGVGFSLVSLHPHSGSLQIWLELGAVGAVLAALALIVGGLRLAHVFAADRQAAAGAAGVLASIGLIANVSYGVWQEWWIATAFAAAALVSASRRESPAAEEAQT